ncbi:MAG: DUF5058 family protein [Synergistaceae bacterium]|nr:DUF5058 family protein [Synergistaceae bacterium]
MDVKYAEIANSLWMYAFVTVIIVCVTAQSLIFMSRAWSRARDLGLTDEQIKKGLVTGVSISIMPTLPVLIVFISLIPLMGVPLPWLRLTVIGSAMYETFAASVGVKAVGEELAVNGYSAYAWTSAAWTMAVGGCACVIWSIFATKPIATIYDRVAKFDVGLVLAVGTGCLAAVMANVSTSYGFSNRSRCVVFMASFAASVAIMQLHKKLPQQRWLTDFNMAISMIVGMIIACVAL